MLYLYRQPFPKKIDADKEDLINVTNKNKRTITNTRSRDLSLVKIMEYNDKKTQMKRALKMVGLPIFCFLNSQQ